MVDRFTYAFGLSFAIAALFNAALVIAKETVPSVLDGMNALTGHHWMTHSLLAMGVFVAAGVALLLKTPGSVRALTLAVAGATILSSGVIAGYFLLR